MRVQLICPAHPIPHIRETEKAGYVPPLGLALLAALTPPDVDISITEETFDALDFESPVDLVGISVMTPVAPRAFEIADNYLRRGVPVVLGGIHPTLVPGDCLPHATSIVRGDAERLWRQVIQDAQAGKLRRIYRDETLPSLEGLPPPRLDLIKNKTAYFVSNIVQATRGCIHHCSFCSVSALSKGAFRSRPVPDVLRDIERSDGDLFVFVDDNIAADPSYAKHLFREMIPLRKSWIGEMGLSVADDRELLALAAKAGCKGIYVGFESISASALLEVRKGAQQHRQIPLYREKIDCIRRFGIALNGGFIFGFDADTPDIFRRTLDFALSSNLDLAQFQALNPFPGTPLFKKLDMEGRILTRDWSRYIWRYVTYRPKHLLPAQIEESLLELYRSYYSLRNLIKRSAKWLDLGSPYSWGLALIVNLGYRKRKDA